MVLTVHATISTVPDEAATSVNAARWTIDQGLRENTLCNTAAKRGNIAVLDRYRNQGTWLTFGFCSSAWSSRCLEMAPGERLQMD